MIISNKVSSKSLLLVNGIPTIRKEINDNTKNHFFENNSYSEKQQSATSFYTLFDEILNKLSK